MRWDAIHPGATEMVELFGLLTDLGHLSEEAFFGRVHRFTLEARGRRTQARPPPSSSSTRSCGHP